MRPRALASTLLPFFICLTIASTVFAASPARVSVDSPTVRQGEEAKATLRLDSAPNGLAGYTIEVSLGDEGVAKIVRVEFPRWAKLSDSSINVSRAVLKAVDLDDEVKPGATNVELATVVFGDTKQGESSIKLSVVRMDDDNGNPIAPLVEPGRLVVQGAGGGGALGASPEVLLLASIVVVVAAIGIGVALYTRRVRARAVKGSAATS
jgi:hypothetical protein